MLRAVAILAMFVAACDGPPSDAELSCIANYLNRTGPGVTTLVNRYRAAPGDGEHLYNGLRAVMQRQTQIDLRDCPQDLRDRHGDMMAAFAPARDAVDALVAARRAPAPTERQRILNMFTQFGERAQDFTKELVRYRTHPRIEPQLGPWIDDMQVLTDQLR